MIWNPPRHRRDMRVKFYKLYRKKAKLYKPVKVQVPAGSTLFALVNVRRAIREAAKRKTQLFILYTRISEPKRSIEYYKISPISFRYKRLRVGIRKVLYAWDMELLPHQMSRKMRYPKKYKGVRKIRGTLKNFVLRNILNCHVTDEPYPPWAKKRRIEII